MISLLLVATITATLIFLSSIVTYLVEKHSVEYTGRKITMDKLHINLFLAICALTA